MADAAQILKTAGADFAAGRLRAAAEGYRRVAALAPHLPLARYNLGVCLEQLGEIEEAQAIFRGLLESALRVRALVKLAVFDPSGIDDHGLADLAAAASDPEGGDGPAFALGEALDARGRYDEAFAAFTAGNARMRAPSDPQALAAREASYRMAEQTYTPSLLSLHAGEGHASNAPIFVIGMPRSGSSLIEQILASHPAVRGVGENSGLDDCLRGQYPLGGAKAPNHFRRRAADYLERTKGPTRRFVDKSLSNDLHVGAIHLMFPRATILYAERNALDAGLSCFRKPFRAAAEFATDLAEIGAEWVRRRRLLEHWDRILPGRIVRVRNEDLIANPQTAIPRLVAACGLSWDERCLDFHSTVRPVRTASTYQVRRPLFTTSQGRWRRYRQHLGPLIEALGPYAAEALG